jgi:hypothetical protein
MLPLHFTATLARRALVLTPLLQLTGLLMSAVHFLAANLSDVAALLQIM